MVIDGHLWSFVVICGYWQLNDAQQMTAKLNDSAANNTFVTETR